MTTPPLTVVLDGATSAELVVSFAALADPTWRGVFLGAADDLRRCPAPLRRTAEQLGRYGLLNLLEVAVGRDTDALLEELAGCGARDLHRRVVGGHRRQLRELLTLDEIDRALDGRPAPLKAALTATILTTTPWLLRTPSAQVQQVLVEALTAWRDLRLPPEAEAALARRLGDAVGALAAAHDPRDPQATLAAAADGLTYDPPGAPRTLVLCAAPAVHPIVAVVDDVDRHVICFSPGPDLPARDRLLAMTRALGDDTRLQLVELLRIEAQTAGQLTAELGVPRTSLLHHLAILRAARLVTTKVEDGRTIYRWRPDALASLASAAQEHLG